MPRSVCVAATQTSNGLRLAAVLRDGIHRLPVGLSPHHWKVLRALLGCRTGVLGGEVCRCEECHCDHFEPFACRNRHCPDCQGNQARQWLEQQQECLLPVPYFHLVFTLPHVLNRLVGQNLASLGDLLFACATQTLLQLGRQRLGVELGLTAVLHTWGQSLVEHYHLHLIVTGGGLSVEGSWKGVKNPHYLLPVRVLSKIFRAKFCEGLQRLYARDKLQFVGALAPLAQPHSFRALLRKATLTPWVVYAKRPFAGPATVLKYLSQYTHRVAISSRRLLTLDTQLHRVCFRYRDYADGHRMKTMTLDTGEFTRRFCQHILPRGFTKLRHYGLLANRSRSQRLEKARAALGVAIPVPTNTTLPLNQPVLPEQSAQPTEFRRCPYCGGVRLRVVQILRPPNWRQPGGDSS